LDTLGVPEEIVLDGTAELDVTMSAIRDRIGQVATKAFEEARFL
jgi:hypothetical protein